MVNRYAYGGTRCTESSTIQYPTQDDLDATKEDIEVFRAQLQKEVNNTGLFIQRIRMRSQEPPQRQLNRLRTSTKAFRMGKYITPTHHGNMIQNLTFPARAKLWARDFVGLSVAMGSLTGEPAIPFGQTRPYDHVVASPPQVLFSENSIGTSRLHL